MPKTGPGAQEVLPVLQEGQEGGQAAAGVRGHVRGAGLRGLHAGRRQGTQRPTWRRRGDAGGAL